MDTGGLILAGIAVARKWPGATEKTQIRVVPGGTLDWQVHIFEPVSVYADRCDATKAIFQTETIRLEQYVLTSDNSGMWIGYGPLSDQLVFWSDDF